MSDRIAPSDIRSMTRLTMQKLHGGSIDKWERYAVAVDDMYRHQLQAIDDPFGSGRERLQDVFKRAVREVERLAIALGDL